MNSRVPRSPSIHITMLWGKDPSTALSRDIPVWLETVQLLCVSALSACAYPGKTHHPGKSHKRGLSRRAPCSHCSVWVPAILPSSGPARRVHSITTLWYPAMLGHLHSSRSFGIRSTMCLCRHRPAKEEFGPTGCAHGSQGVFPLACPACSSAGRRDWLDTGWETNLQRENHATFCGFRDQL